MPHDTTDEPLSTPGPAAIGQRSDTTTRPGIDDKPASLSEDEWQLPLGLLHRAGLSLPGKSAEADVMSRRDALTGLLHRMAFMSEVQQRMPSFGHGCILMFDIDHFKPVNDHWGQPVGDEVIVALAARIKGSLPFNAVVARQGGDEFVAFVPVPLERGGEIAGNVVDAARAPIPLANGRELLSTLSAGVAPLATRHRLEEAIRAADSALYAAKGAGRDRVQIFNDETAGVVGARRSLASAVATLQERNAQLLELVETDALTGLRSRRALDQVLQSRCGGSHSTWPECSVAFLDIDHFGNYNKLYNDPEGDKVLRIVAQTLRATARRDDLVFRKGGEELIVVMPDTSRHDAHAAAERMRQAVESLAIAHAGSAVADVVTVRVGVATAVPDQPASVADLMDRAAALAMRAKRLHQRNRVHAEQA